MELILSILFGGVYAVTALFYGFMVRKGMNE